MATSTKYEVIDLEKGTLDRKIFVDKEIYEVELEKVFGRAWQMVGHESLVPNPNDFFLTYMGEDPVILTRDGKGELHAFLNMCRHRGNRIVRADDGNAKNFMCAYHGWTFSNEGKLVSVPGLQEAYYGELDVENLGLIQARLDTYAELIFATWDETAPSLEAYLGDARWYMDLRFNRRDCGMQALGPQKWIEPTNWKTPVDNSSDNYHVPVSHFSATLVQQRRFSLRRSSPNDGPGMGHQQLFQSPNRHAFTNGHSMTVRVLADDQVTYNRAVDSKSAPFFDEFHKATIAEAEERLGAFRARRLRLGNHSLFPNTVLGLRLAFPRGPLFTEFWSFQVYEKDAPFEVIKATQLDHDQNNGISGLNEQDDMDNWAQVTESGLSVTARKYLQDLSMGTGHAKRDPQFPGLVAETFTSESNQRNFYMQWQSYMNATSWAGIPIEPITANFEGRATMKG